MFWKASIEKKLDSCVFTNVLFLYLKVTNEDPGAVAAAAWFSSIGKILAPWVLIFQAISMQYQYVSDKITLGIKTWNALYFKMSVVVS